MLEYKGYCKYKYKDYRVAIEHGKLGPIHILGLKGLYHYKGLL